MERRKAIKNIGLSFGAFIATPAAVSMLQGCQTEAPWIPEFFTEEEGKVLRKLVDTILPAVDDLPSATEVNVHVFIDKFVSTVMEESVQADSREALGLVTKELLASAGKESVDGLKSSHYETYLGEKLRKTKDEDQAFKDQMMAGVQTDELIVYSYLTGMRGMSIWAYKTNERIGEQVLAYKSIPGEQKGCIDLQEATGGKAWAL